MSRAPRVRDRRVALLGGAACLVAGTYLIWDAYDARGIKRPWGLHFLPGL